MRLFYGVNGIPEILEDRPPLGREPMTEQKMEVVLEHTTQAILPVDGDCVERSGVEDGGWVAVDLAHMPRAPKYGKDGYVDVCLCLAKWPGMDPATVMVKAYTGRWGDQHTVSTRYADQWVGGEYRMDVSLFAERVYGVVFASWGRDGRLKWQRDPLTYSLWLPDAPTIRCVDIGGPMDLSEVRI